MVAGMGIGMVAAATATIVAHLPPIADGPKGERVSRMSSSKEVMDGVLVWTMRTLTKIKGEREKRRQFLLQMMQLFYSLLMGSNAIIDGVPSQQYLGPLNSTSLRASNFISGRRSERRGSGGNGGDTSINLASSNY